MAGTDAGRVPWRRAQYPSTRMGVPCREPMSRQPARVPSPANEGDGKNSESTSTTDDVMLVGNWKTSRIVEALQRAVFARGTAARVYQVAPRPQRWKTTLCVSSAVDRIFTFSARNHHLSLDCGVFSASFPFRISHRAYRPRSRAAGSRPRTIQIGPAPRCTWATVRGDETAPRTQQSSAWIRPAFSTAASLRTVGRAVALCRGGCSRCP